jgi:two-component system, sporulation sensor kinase E
MRRFIQRALQKIEKMDPDRIRLIVGDMSSENELLEMVLDSMSDGVVVTDREGCILLFNKSSERLIPFVPGDIMEKPLWQTIDDREISDFIKQEFEAQETVWDRSFALEDGTGRIVSYSIMPLVRDGSIQGSLIHIEDVTEKKAKEARLRRAESLAALTTMAAGVAHEIKNPLGSMSIHLQLMQKEMEGKSTVPTKRLREYLDVLNEEVDRLNTTVMDFLFAVRPMDTKLVAQDLNQVIRDLLDFMKFELEEAEIEVTLDLQEIPKIELDDKYVKHALLNLIKNSLDAMPEGGRLNIRTRSSSEMVFVDIIDSGEGIPEENLGKIFEPYFTTKDFSSGLGLTLVYKIVKEHNGELSVKSKNGEGTTFTLSFPIPQGEKRLIGFKGERRYEV